MEKYPNYSPIFSISNFVFFKWKNRLNIFWVKIFCIQYFYQESPVLYQRFYQEKQQSQSPNVLYKKGILKNWQNSWENTCASVSSFIKLQAWGPLLTGKVGPRTLRWDPKVGP